jgi:hypothetical protein
MFEESEIPQIIRSRHMAEEFDRAKV